MRDGHTAARLWYCAIEQSYQQPAFNSGASPKTAGMENVDSQAHAHGDIWHLSGVVHTLPYYPSGYQGTRDEQFGMLPRIHCRRLVVCWRYTSNVTASTV